MSDGRVDALLNRLRPVTSRRAGVALGVWGEAGIGKSHVTQGALAALTCGSLTVPAGSEASRWAAALPRPRRLPAWAGRTLDAVAAGSAFDPVDGPAAVSAVLALLAPFVLHLEDLHEIDAARLDVVIRLGHDAARVRGVGVLVSGRDPAPAPFGPLRLAPLDRDAAIAMLEAHVGGALPESAAAWLFERSAGHPLYALEFVRFLARRGYLWNDGGRWRWRSPTDDAVPASVEALVEQRLASGPAEHRAVLEALAVLGDGGDRAAWARTAGVTEGDLEAAIDAWTRSGVLADGAFAHPLFRERVRVVVDADEGRALARRAFDATRADPLRAARYVDAADVSPAEAVRVLEAAAAASGDVVFAAHVRAQASRYARGARRGQLALAAANVLQHHDLPEAERLVRTALEVRATRAAALPMWVHLLARTGRQAEADDWTARMPADLRRRLPAAALQVTSRSVAGDHRAAWTLWEAHPELHDAPTPGLLRAVTGCAISLGRMADARALASRGLEAAADPFETCEFLSLRALIEYHAGEPRAAVATIGRALTLLEELGAPRLRATALLNLAAFQKAAGDHAGMGGSLEACVRLRREAGEGRGTAFALAALAELRIDQGRLDEADDLLAEAVPTLERYGPSRFLANARSIAAQLARAQGTPLGRLTACRLAERSLDEARALGNPRSVRELLFDASIANTEAGHADRGLALALESEALADAAGDAPIDRYRARWAAAVAWVARGERERAEDAFVAAVEEAERVEAAVDAQRIGLALARLRGDDADVRARVAWFAARGLAHGLERSEPASDDAAPVAARDDARDVRLEVLGPMQVRLGTETVLVRGEKGRRLLALLVEARVTGRGGLGKLALLDDLYPDQSEARAASSLKELVRGLRQRFSVALIATTATGYALGAVPTDVERFLATLEPTLWRGPYLDGLDLDLDGPARDSLYVALERLAAELVARDPQQSARLSGILVDAEPYRVDYLATNLGALRAAGQHRSLGRRYGAARERLAELGEALPPRWQEFLAQA